MFKFTSRLSLLLISLAFTIAVSDNKNLPAEEPVEEEQIKVYNIEGSVEVEGKEARSWVASAKVLVDGGKRTGYINAEGGFKIYNVPAGSYLIEVVSPNYVFEPARVDISSKSGKIRARKVNLLKTASVAGLQYPLQFKTKSQAEFFDKREKWNVLDMAKNPMVLFMVVPVLIMLVMPKLIGNMDAETHKEMQESMQAMQGKGLPSIEEMFTNLFRGGGTKKPSNKPSQKKKQ